MLAEYCCTNAVVICDDIFCLHIIVDLKNQKGSPPNGRHLLHLKSVRLESILLVCKVLSNCLTINPLIINICDWQGIIFLLFRTCLLYHSQYF
uniref:Uncharacterized protein n=1 Tax=uncultured marine virus TaxID=186617 RepID=A0A0F7L7G3_9VIRU|nr:hypothetical protein [uncultured marine virus]